MSFSFVPPGLAGFLSDTRDFLLAIHFLRPELLWLLFWLPILAILTRYAAIRQRHAAAAIGRPAAVATLRTPSRLPRRWPGLANPLGWIALLLGLAGPCWGTSDDSGVAVGRDLILVIDLSQSMKADDMASTSTRTRWQAARAAALDLLDTISHRGGHRIGVVVFAARPKLLVPLTTDYDHVRSQVEELDGAFPPPEVRPGADPAITSGTRIGAALIAAVAAQDPRFPGSQDMILLSDGDDPVDDREWLQGANAARKAQIPVHTVGLGNPDRPTFMVIGEQHPTEMSTKLEEGPLQEIATETRGLYLPARREIPHLGEFFQNVIEPHPSRELSDESIPQPKERYLWFLGSALCLFSVGWVRGR